jgi:hypothetical protein
MSLARTQTNQRRVAKRPTASTFCAWRNWCPSAFRSVTSKDMMTMPSATGWTLSANQRLTPSGYVNSFARSVVSPVARLGTV